MRNLLALCFILIGCNEEMNKRLTPQEAPCSKDYAINVSRYYHVSCGGPDYRMRFGTTGDVVICECKNLER